VLLAIRELGYSMREIGRRLGMSQPGVLYAVERGEGTATERELELTN
jgi:DNA-binding CsgD family transcriptional regulator